MKVFVELTKEEKALVKEYARANGITIHEAFRNTLLEKIEKEHEATIMKLAFMAHVKKEMKTRPLKDIWNEYML